jgi:hypothetical protein
MKVIYLPLQNVHLGLTLVEIPYSHHGLSEAKELASEVAEGFNHLRVILIVFIHEQITMAETA